MKLRGPQSETNHFFHASEKFRSGVVPLSCRSDEEMDPAQDPQVAPATIAQENTNQGCPKSQRKACLSTCAVNRISWVVIFPISWESVCG